MFAIKQSNWSGEDRDNFILSSAALLNLFSSSFFSMKRLEAAISSGQINLAVVSPEKRLNELIEIASRTMSMREQCSEITDSLLEMYSSLLDTSPKEFALRQFLNDHTGEKIALVVPKAYYSVIFGLALQGEFNSLKDLGKASTLVDDDVKDFIIRTANRMFTSRRLIVNSDELTSRVSTTELNETLDKLEKIEYSKENMDAKRYASNVLLATNMISVGIDVARLNVMLMVGQPKLTSEYIQASSRVGRSFPGVAFVQYDATKSRDRSHYERFRAYHDSFYRFVEPTGATPFSKPARERALHAVIATLLRHKESLTEDKDADYFDAEAFEQSIQDIETYVTDRIKGINARADAELKDDIADVEDEMQEFFEYWQDMIDKAHEETDTPVCFGRRYMVTPPTLGARRLFKQYNSDGKDEAKETLTSMRNVDVSVKGSVIIWEN